MYSMQLSDNADADHPLTMRFYIPGNVLRINSCLITWDVERFRTHIKMAKSGGGGGRTSSEGGGATVSLPAHIVSTTFASKGPESGPQGDTSGSTSSALSGPDSVRSKTDSDGAGTSGTPRNVNDGSTMTNTGTSSLSISEAGGHHHSTKAHTHTSGDHRHTVSSSSSYTGWASPSTQSGGGEDTGNAGSHSHSIDNHNHGMNHNHTIPAHTHGMSHYHTFLHMHHVEGTVTIPSMTFNLSAHSHTFTIPEHTHEMEYGIYEGERAETVTLLVDRESVPPDTLGDKRELDIAPYLRKNEAGRVTRGAWHEVEFKPDQNSRITANLFFQVFIQSRGAGDY